MFFHVTVVSTALGTYQPWNGLQYKIILKKYFFFFKSINIQIQRFHEKDFFAAKQNITNFEFILPNLTTFISLTITFCRFWHFLISRNMAFRDFSRTKYLFIESSSTVMLNWYLVKSDLSSIRFCTRGHWSSQF